MSELGTPAVKGRQLKSMLPIMVLVGLSVVIACGLTGDAAVLAMSRFAMDGGVVLAWAAAAAGIGCWPLRWLGVRTQSTALMVALSLGLGWGVMSIAVLLLGLAGVVGAGVSWGVVAVGIVAGLVAIKGKTVGEGEVEEGKGDWTILLFVPLLSVGLFLTLAPAGFLWKGEPNGYDVVAYHFQLPREWWEMGRIAPLKHNVFSFFPLAMEMHYLVAFGMLGGPFAGAYAAQMMHLAFFAAAGLGAYGALLPLGRGSAVVAALGVLAAPHCLLTAPIGYNEGVQVLYGVLLIAVCLGPWTVGRAVVAGMCVGFAVGGKLTGLPLWGLVPVMAIAAGKWVADGAGAGKKISAIGVYGVALVIAISPWLVRTAAWSGGNPVFPVAMKALGKGHFTDEQVDRFDRAHSPREDQTSVGGRLKAFGEQVLSAPEFGWVVVPGAAVAGVVLIALRDRFAMWLVGALVVQLGVWLFATHLQGRFFVPALPIAGMLLGLLAARQKVLAAIICLVLAGVSVYSVGLAWSRLDYLRDNNGKFFAGLIGSDYASLQQNLKPPELKDVPTDVTLNLVGDVRVFSYTRPMKRLKYTSVFDAVGGDVKTAWRVEPGEALWIDPGELSRFAKTAYRTPAPPAEWMRPEPFLIMP